MLGDAVVRVVLGRVHACMHVGGADVARKVVHQATRISIFPSTPLGWFHFGSSVQ